MRRDADDELNIISFIYGKERKQRNTIGQD